MNSNDQQDDADAARALEHARTCAHQTLDLLLAHRIPPAPPHYAVGYSYCCGEAGALRDALDSILRANKPLEETLLRDLYERFIVPDPLQRYSDMRSDLRQILQSILQTLQTAQNGTSEFRLALERNIARLTVNPDAQMLRAIAADLLSAANRIGDRTTALQQDLLSTQQQVQALRDELERHRREAMIDPLTSLLNRRAMSQLLGELLATAGDAPFSMLVADIDHFKSINDTYGHAVGDVVIRHVADTLRKSIRGEDIAIRYGGEEFVILLLHTPLDGALNVAETIRGRVAALRLVRRQDKHALKAFTISIGVAQRRPDDTQESLFERADQALYVSKTEGRDRVTAEDRLTCELRPEGSEGPPQ